ncbi:hypothetical protein niasHT_033870 [Heterodera trifolii]|uniref:SCP domain-containing protein n=1 Tax=Heterodera trifolii TaxID=157864 RepID=A0ABD2ICU5_9BILA
MPLFQQIRCRMRRLFGGASKSASLRDASREGEAGGDQAAVSNGKQQHKSGGGRVGFPPFLRKSQSTHERKKGDDKNHVGPSRTFDGAADGTAKSPHSADFLGPISSAGTADAQLISSSYSDTHMASDMSELADGDLDRQLMQTCTDVKYVNRRPGKCSAVVDANFQRQCLQAHNYVRQVYSSPPLLWSQELAALAKTWALKLADRGSVLYPELPGIGENIFLLTGKCNGTAADVISSPSAGMATNCPPIGDHLTTGIELVAHWAAEANKMDFARPRWNNETKNFTQMVWRSAMEMGVARHWNTAKNCLAIVAFYRPAGNSNLPGEFAANLPSEAEATEDALRAITLAALIQALNRTDLGDGGFRKGPLPPVTPRHFVGTPNTTKILKSSTSSSSNTNNGIVSVGDGMSNGGAGAPSGGGSGNA